MIKLRLTYFIKLAVTVVVIFATAQGAEFDINIDLRTKSELGHYSLIFCSRDGRGINLGSHGFVVWTAEDPKRCFTSSESFGYYALTDNLGQQIKAVFAKVDGSVLEDIWYGYEITYLIQVRVDREAYYLSEEVRREWENRRYNLFASNCGTFLRDVARSIGLEVPAEWQAFTPHQLVKKLAELNTPNKEYGRRTSMGITPIVSSVLVINGNQRQNDVDNIKNLYIEFFNSIEEKDIDGTQKCIAPVFKYVSYGMRSDPIIYESEEDKLMIAKRIIRASHDNRKIGLCVAGDTLTEIEFNNEDARLKMLDSRIKNDATDRQINCWLLSVGKVSGSWFITDIYDPF